jgi:hypothetical protein
MLFNDESFRAQDAFSFRVKLRDSPDDEPLTIVIYDWFTQEGSPPRAGNKAEVLVDGAYPGHHSPGSPQFSAHPSVIRR